MEEEKGRGSGLELFLQTVEVAPRWRYVICAVTNSLTLVSSILITTASHVTGFVYALYRAFHQKIHKN